MIYYARSFSPRVVRGYGYIGIRNDVVQQYPDMLVWRMLLESYCFDTFLHEKNMKAFKAISKQTYTNCVSRCPAHLVYSRWRTYVATSAATFHLDICLVLFSLDKGNVLVDRHSRMTL